MEFEKEITVEVDTSLDDLINLLETNGFQLKETYDLNDIYLINKNDKSEDLLSMLGKCVIIRDMIDADKERIMLTYKYKEYNEKQEIINQGKINSEIKDIASMKMIFEKLNFEELISINDHLLVYANDTDELVIQNVNNKYIYIEIEDECNFIDKHYETIDEMKNVIKKYAIPLKEDNYFAKKALTILKEKIIN